MKLVTFSRAMAPFGIGDTRLVPDDVAEQLQTDDMLSAIALWPAPVEPDQAQTPKRPIGRPQRMLGHVPDQRVAR